MKPLQRICIVVAALALAPSGLAQDMDPDLSSRAGRAVDAGLNYLRYQQAENGSWSNSVGITSLVVRAYMESHRNYAEDDLPFIPKAIEFIVGHVLENGAISETNQNLNYNTAVAVVALQATGNPAYDEIIKNGQAFMLGLQADEGENYTPDHKYYGGIGYGGDERPDMSNLYLALEALSKSGVGEEDPVWEKALRFVSRSQNRSESNDQEWAGNDGGFTYSPGMSPHDTMHSYGGITHAGLISLLFAGVDKSDPRIQAAYDWIRANYTLEENPGAPDQQGLYFYYNAFAKSMKAYDEPTITDTDGNTHVWRDDLAAQLISLQSDEGWWVNESPRWLESSRHLCTARAVIALNQAMQ